MAHYSFVTYWNFNAPVEKGVERNSLHGYLDRMVAICKIG